jgi:hypothetical protein
LHGPKEKGNNNIMIKKYFEAFSFFIFSNLFTAFPLLAGTEWIKSGLFVCKNTEVYYSSNDSDKGSFAKELSQIYLKLEQDMLLVRYDKNAEASAIFKLEMNKPQEGYALFSETDILKKVNREAASMMMVMHIKGNNDDLNNQNNPIDALHLTSHQISPSFTMVTKYKCENGDF